VKRGPRILGPPKGVRHGFQGRRRRNYGGVRRRGFNVIGRGHAIDVPGKARRSCRSVASGEGGEPKDTLKNKSNVGLGGGGVRKVTPAEISAENIGVFRSQKKGDSMV